MSLELDNVVNVRETTPGQRNVHIQVESRANDDITRAAHQIDGLGSTVTDELLLRAAYSRPSVVFGDRDGRPLIPGR